MVNELNLNKAINKQKTKTSSEGEKFLKEFQQ